MDDLNVVDGFTETFLTFIDSGFGLLGPDVGFLIRVLVTIDIVLAGLTWAMTAEGDVFAGLLRKVLYVGAFALILNNYAALADIIFASFIDLGLAASGAALRPDDLLRPGFVANTGITAAHPILLDIQTLIGFPEIVVNAVEIAILLLAWLGVVAAFFVLAVQMFVTLVEFKLMALAGFVLVPFALDDSLGQASAAADESCLDLLAQRCVRGRQYPRVVDEIGQIAAISRARMAWSAHHMHLVVIQRLDVHA